MRERLKLSDVEVVEIPWAEPVVSHDFPVIPAETYAKRVESLRARMEEHGLSHVVVYGDREHFANTRWLTGYDPRFEESLTIVGLSGKPRLLVGLEGATMPPLPKAWKWNSMTSSACRASRSTAGPWRKSWRTAA